MFYHICSDTIGNGVEEEGEEGRGKRIACQNTTWAARAACRVLESNLEKLVLYQIGYIKGKTYA